MTFGMLFHESQKLRSTTVFNAATRLALATPNGYADIRGVTFDAEHNVLVIEAEPAAFTPVIEVDDAERYLEEP
jgi:hypothetical protein